MEKSLIVLLEDLVEDEDVSLSFSARGLCIPHAQQAIRTWKQPDRRERLLRIVCRCVEELARDLREFLRKYEHDHRDEAFGREVNAIRRAMEFLMGLDSHQASDKDR